MDENKTIQQVANNIIHQDDSKITIRKLIVKSWNQSIKNDTSRIVIYDKIEETKIIFGELLSNYIANNYNFTGITDDNKLDISNIIITDSYNLWLKNLINLNKENNFLLNEYDVLDDDFPNNKWVELEFN